MAKYATITTFFFAALLLFASFEAPTKVGAQKLCEMLSGTMPGRCVNSNACKVQCITLEGACHGACSNFPSYKCICHFPC